MIVEEALGAVWCGDEFAASDVDGGDALGRNLADEFERVVAAIEAVGEDVVKVEEQAGIRRRKNGVEPGGFGESA